jgi:SHS2 domain-containing protein
MKSFESFDHTADVGLRIYGRDLKQLFVHAAQGMFDLIAEVKKGRSLPERKEVRLKIEALSQEELLVGWLRELLYLASTQQLFFTDFKIIQLEEETPKVIPLRIQAEVVGEKVNETKHVLKKEVKAVTYHGLSLKQGKKSWVAEVIFDV